MSIAPAKTPERGYERTRESDRPHRLGPIARGARPHIEVLDTDEERSVARVLVMTEHDVFHSGTLSVDRDRTSMRYDVRLTTFESLSLARVMRLMELQCRSRFTRVMVDSEGQMVWLQATTAYQPSDDLPQLSRILARDVQCTLEQGRLLFGMKPGAPGIAMIGGGA